VLKANFRFSAGEAIILERELIRLNKPSSRTLEAFRNVFNNVGKTGVPMLDGRSQAIFHDENDLMSLSVNEDADRLTRFLQNYCPVFFIVCFTILGDHL
jgi:hypothetical protein